MSSEKLRQREVHKYYQAWLDSSIGFDSTPSAQPSRYHADGSQLRVSKDKALIAFAQLGCLKLDVKRAVVTLISTEQQYILAEATRTLSLVSGDGDSEVQDQLWFGNALLPRSQGVSGDALAPAMYTAVGPNGSTRSAPALVIDDMTKDVRYCSKPYAGKGVTFYSGVPILTDAGIPIGVYNATDDKPRDGLRPDELRFMHDMAATVMRHLDVVSNEAARFRGETMVLGLGQFVSGAPSLYEWTTSTGTSTQAPSPNLGSSSRGPIRQFKGMSITAASTSKIHPASPTKSRPDHKSVDFHLDTEQHKGMFQPEANLALTDTRPAAEINTSQQEDRQSKPRSRSDADERAAISSDNIFTRAARILQECVAADGVLFFDAVSTNFAKGTNTSGLRSFDAVPEVSTTVDGAPLALAQKDQEAKDNNHTYYSGASEESDIGSSHDSERRMCKLLGHSFDASSQASSDISLLESIRMTEYSLGRLVKIYPQGKLFNFSDDSSLTASDGEHLTEDANSKSRTMKAQRSSNSDKSKRIPRAIVDELERLVPSAQRIVWLPLWDFSKQRWSAGLFLWSRRPDRLVAAQDDLVYLKAFGNSIMVEVARLEAAIADTAKSTFIANISHELRTPLHGILGNLDILQETKLNDFQQSLVTAIEVCGRTLSDTIDHVLDYSKINQLSKYSRKRNKSNSNLLPSLSQSRRDSSTTSSIEEYFDIASIVEEACEAAYASHAFQSSGHGRLRATSIGGSRTSKDPPLPPVVIPKVQVVTKIEHRGNWWVYSQPSAIRRVVTNLFGNALKYTDAGTITVSLSSSGGADNEITSPKLPVRLTIKDSGRGMSSDFVRNHAFTPFSQESQFSTGTGLGLSIVQQIVKALGGKIELQSDQGIGTEIRVLLQLPTSSNEDLSSQSTTPLDQTASMPKLSATSVLVTFPESKEMIPVPSGIAAVIASVETTARNWYGLRVLHPDRLHDQQVDLVVYVAAPTFQDLSQASHRSSWSPRTRLIVVVPNTIEKAAMTPELSDHATQLGVDLDILSFPLGPHKLGQAFSRYEEALSAKSDPKTLLGNTTEQLPSLRLRSLHTARPSSLHEGMSKSKGKSAAGEPGPSKHRSTQSQDLPRSTDLLENTQQQPSIAVISRTEDVSLPSVVGGILERPSISALAGSNPRPTIVMPRSISAPAPLLFDGNRPDRSLLRVLLVDDNEINLNILKTCMKRAQIQYDFAKDGLEASNTFQHGYNTKCPFTHVLMDISMPIMDGIQSTRVIREFERKQSNALRRVPQSHVSEANILIDNFTPVVDIDDQDEIAPAIVIALSGVASETIQLDMLEAGADMFLPKPVKLKELLKILGP